MGWFAGIRVVCVLEDVVGGLMVVCLFVDAIAAVVAQCKAGAKITDLCDTGDTLMNECVACCSSDCLVLVVLNRWSLVYAELLPKNSRGKILKRVLLYQHVFL